MRLSATILKSQTEQDLKLNPPDATRVNKVLPGDFKDQKVLRLTCLVLSADQKQTWQIQYMYTAKLAGDQDVWSCENANKYRFVGSIIAVFAVFGIWICFLSAGAALRIEMQVF